VLILSQQGGVQKGRLRLENSSIAGRADVVGNHIREPEQVVGNTRADAGAARRMPPVLDIPLLELPAGCQKDLLARQLRPGVKKGHDILQLVAETESAAGLVKSGTPPEAAA